MELFNEVKNRYFRIIIKVLNQSVNGMSREEIIKIIDEDEYSQKLIDKNSRTFSGMLLNDYNENYSYGLLEKKGEKYYPKINKSKNIIPIRLTMVEKIWLKSILETDLIKLFLDNNIIDCLRNELKNIDLCIKKEYIELTNVIKCEYEYSENYKYNFRIILESILNEQVISYYKYNKKTNNYDRFVVFPVAVEYSVRDNNFRVSMYLIDYEISVIENIFELKDVSVQENVYEITRKEVLEVVYNFKYSKEPIVLEVLDERQAMERCFMCFSGLERTARIIGEKKYEITLMYYLFNEEEIIRNILSLGPYVRVISPLRIKEEIVSRLKKTLELLGVY